MTKDGYQRNKYLDDLGISIKNYGTNFLGKEDKRWKFWKKERKKYGFDERECWNLEARFVEWIYSRFKKYKEDTVVDLDYHLFRYQSQPDVEPVNVTQGEAIDIVCEACKKYLLQEFTDRPFLSEEIIKLIGDVMPYMWW